MTQPAFNCPLCEGMVEAATLLPCVEHGKVREGCPVYAGRLEELQERVLEERDGA